MSRRGCPRGVRVVWAGMKWVRLISSFSVSIALAFGGSTLAASPFDECRGALRRAGIESKASRRAKFLAESATRCREALTAEPDSADARIGLALALFASGDDEAAQATIGRLPDAAGMETTRRIAEVIQLALSRSHEAIVGTVSVLCEASEFGEGALLARAVADRVGVNPESPFVETVGATRYVYGNVPPVPCVPGYDFTRLHEFAKFPVALETRPPRLPRSTNPAGAVGKVELLVYIDKQGKTIPLAVSPIRDSAAAAAVMEAGRSWTWSPGRWRGQPAAFTTIVTVRFGG